MARLNIDTGTEGNSATGDTLRTAMTKINTNFIEVYDDLAGASLGGLFTNNQTNGDVKIQANGTGIVEIDRLSINNTTITSMDTNADLILAPNGTGGIVAQGVFTAGEIVTNEITSNGSNADITLEPQGTGDILLKPGGQVGIGAVSSPDTSLHIKQSTATITLQRTNDNNTPGIDFQSNGGNVRAKIFMDGNNGTNKEIVFQNMDGSLAEKFRVTLGGAKVTGLLDVTGDLTTGAISITDNKITTSRSNDDLNLSAAGTGNINIGDITFNGSSLSSSSSGDITFNDGLNVKGSVTSTSFLVQGALASPAVLIGDGIITIGRTAGGYILAENNATYTGESITGNSSNADFTIQTQGTGNVIIQEVGFIDNKISTTASNLDLQLDASGSGAIEMIPVIIKMANLPTSDPGVAGQLWRSGTDLKISIG